MTNTIAIAYLITEQGDEVPDSYTPCVVDLSEERLRVREPIEVVYPASLSYGAVNRVRLRWASHHVTMALLSVMHPGDTLHLTADSALVKEASNDC